MFYSPPITWPFLPIKICAHEKIYPNVSKPLLVFWTIKALRRLDKSSSARHQQKGMLALSSKKDSRQICFKVQSSCLFSFQFGNICWSCSSSLDWSIYHGNNFNLLSFCIFILFFTNPPKSNCGLFKVFFIILLGQ